MSESVEVSESITVSPVDKTVTLKGLSHTTTVTIQPGQTVAQALAGANIQSDSIDLLLGGTRVDASEVSHSDVSDEQEIVTPPKNANLG